MKLWKFIQDADCRGQAMWVTGAGQPGCLYDYGPVRYDSKDDAIEGIVDVICSEFGPLYQDRVRKDLEENGIHYFHPNCKHIVGHSYVEIEISKED